MRPLTLILASSLSLAACTPQSASPTGDFRLLSLDGAPLTGSASMTLGPDGAVHGEGPCNAWHAKNTAAAPAFRLTPIASTRRACLIEGGEGAYFAALQAAERMTVTAGGLILSGAAHRLEFRRR